MLEQAIRAEADALKVSQEALVGELQARIQQLEYDVEAAHGQSEDRTANREQEIEQLKSGHQAALSDALAASAAEIAQLRTENKVRLDFRHCGSRSAPH